MLSILVVTSRGPSNYFFTDIHLRPCQRRPSARCYKDPKGGTIYLLSHDALWTNFSSRPWLPLGGERRVSSKPGGTLLSTPGSAFPTLGSANWLQLRKLA